MRKYTCESGEGESRPVNLAKEKVYLRAFAGKSLSVDLAKEKVYL
jgi:hypothetical protein